MANFRVLRGPQPNPYDPSGSGQQIMFESDCTGIELRTRHHAINGWGVTLRPALNPVGLTGWDLTGSYLDTMRVVEAGWVGYGCPHVDWVDVKQQLQRLGVI